MQQRKRDLSVLVVFILTIFLMPTILQATTKNLLIPAYGNPCCGTGTEMWSKLIGSAKKVNDGNLDVHFYVIFNPASGPGLAVDPNYYNPSNPEVGNYLPKLVEAGGDHVTILGYIATGYGIKSLEEIKENIEGYERLYPEFVDGIFFDEMSNEIVNVDLYRQAYLYAKSVTSNGLVIGNPGVFIIQEYIENADVFVTFENYGSEYNNYSVPSWLNKSRIAHLVHTQASLTTDLVNQIRNNAGMYYITDDVMSNPWDALASYWDELVFEKSGSSSSLAVVRSFLLRSFNEE